MNFFHKVPTFQTARFCSGRILHLKGVIKFGKRPPKQLRHQHTALLQRSVYAADNKDKVR